MMNYPFSLWVVLECVTKVGAGVDEALLEQCLLGGRKLTMLATVWSSRESRGHARAVTLRKYLPGNTFLVPHIAPESGEHFHNRITGTLPCAMLLRPHSGFGELVELLSFSNKSHKSYIPLDNNSSYSQMA